MSKVAELESQIRDIFNIPRRHRNTRTDRANFNQACSALDAIGDTELALQEFKSNNPPPLGYHTFSHTVYFRQFFFNKML